MKRNCLTNKGQKFKKKLVLKMMASNHLDQIGDTIFKNEKLTKFSDRNGILIGDKSWNKFILVGQMERAVSTKC